MCAGCSGRRWPTCAPDVAPCPSGFTDGAAFRDFFKTNYGPTIAAYRAVGDDPRRLAELDAALARLGDEALAGGREMSWEYLLFVARRR